MTPNIIDAATIAAVAFQGVGYVPKEAITIEIIDQVEIRFILPVIGQDLANAISSGDYPELFDKLVIPVSLYTKHYIDHPNDPATPKNIATARSYMKQLSEYLNKNKTKYKEYEPSRNILNRCSIAGGIVI